VEVSIIFLFLSSHLQLNRLPILTAQGAVFQIRCGETEKRKNLIPLPGIKA
jgi:hypothetical protein